MSKSNLKGIFKSVAGLGAVLLLAVWGTEVLAAEDITSIAGRLEEQLKSIGPVLGIVSYIAGIAFCIAGIVQFKEHKDNPAQVPLSKPIVYIAVGAGLLFLPSLIESAGSSIFGSTDNKAKDTSNF